MWSPFSDVLLAGTIKLVCVDDDLSDGSYIRLARRSRPTRCWLDVPRSSQCYPAVIPSEVEGSRGVAHGPAISCTTFTETGGNRTFNPITNGDNVVEVVEFHRVIFAITGSCQGFLDH